VKKLFGFVLVCAIAGGSFHLIRTHDQAIPLSEKQVSFLNATHYASGEDINITGGSEENAILERINSLRAGKDLPPLELDKSAVLLAVYHSALMRKQGKLDFDLTGHTSLETRKTDIGISEPCFYALYSDISISRVLEQIEGKEDPLYTKSGLTHAGIGVVRQTFPWQYWITVIYIKRIALTDEFPVYIPTIPHTETLRWRLKEDYSEQAVKMTTPAGTVKELTVKDSIGGMYEAEIPFRKQGKYIIEILANGTYGVEVANVMPVYVRVQREKELTHEVHSFSDKDEGSLAKAMFGLINSDRAKSSLKPLQFSSRLSAVARIHSRNMAKNRNVAHELPGCRNLSQRLQDAGLKILKQAENVASDISIEEAQENLMNSPGHRQAILDTDFSHVGIGIVKQKNQLYVTQNFVSFIPEVSLLEGKRTLLRKINRLGNSHLRENRALSSIAQKHSEKTASSGKLLDASGLKDKLSSSGVKFQQVCFLVVNAATIEQIVGEIGKNPNVRPGSMEEIGIGLRQSNDGALWVTVILKR
jgi:uncharacterized protein YkwD